MLLNEKDLLIVGSYNLLIIDIQKKEITKNIKINIFNINLLYKYKNPKIYKIKCLTFHIQ